MNHEEQDHSADTIAAVELTAEDLVDLSRPQLIDLSQAQIESALMGERANEAPAPAALPVAQRTLSSSSKRLSGVALGFGCIAIVASIALGARYAGANFNSERVTPPTTLAWTPIPERPEPIEVEVEPEVVVPTTLFANPFDKTEIFELPPGTTKEEAREIVAQILIERARERTRR
jgi:hypothetical protein